MQQKQQCQNTHYTLSYNLSKELSVCLLLIEIKTEWQDSQRECSELQHQSHSHHTKVNKLHHKTLSCALKVNLSK